MAASSKAAGVAITIRYRESHQATDLMGVDDLMDVSRDFGLDPVMLLDPGGLFLYIGNDAHDPPIFFLKKIEHEFSLMNS